MSTDYPLTSKSSGSDFERPTNEVEKEKTAASFSVRLGDDRVS
jgi:hypothetical protein